MALALIGPSIDLEATSAMWDDPSPAPKSAAVLDIQATNEGGAAKSRSSFNVAKTRASGQKSPAKT